MMYDFINLQMKLNIIKEDSKPFKSFRYMHVLNNWYFLNRLDKNRRFYITCNDMLDFCQLYNDIKNIIVDIDSLLEEKGIKITYLDLNTKLVGTIDVDTYVPGPINTNARYFYNICKYDKPAVQSINIHVETTQLSVSDDPEIEKYNTYRYNAPEVDILLNNPDEVKYSCHKDYVYKVSASIYIELVNLIIDIIYNYMKSDMFKNKRN